MTTPAIIWEQAPLFPRECRLYLVLRGVFGTIALLLQFYAFKHLPLGDASVVIFSSPVFVVIFARVFLKESCSIVHVVLIAFTMIGVILVIQPPIIFNMSLNNYAASEWKGVAAAFVSTLVASNVYILLRLIKSIHFLTSLFNFSIVALIIILPIVFFSNAGLHVFKEDEKLMVIALAFLSFFGQVFKTKALQLENAGPIAIARTSDVIFSFIWQYLFFGQHPSYLTLIGAVIIISCVMGLAVHKWMSR